MSCLRVETKYSSNNNHCLTTLYVAYSLSDIITKFFSYLYFSHTNTVTPLEKWGTCSNSVSYNTKANRNGHKWFPCIKSIVNFCCHSICCILKYSSYLYDPLFVSLLLCLAVSSRVAVYTLFFLFLHLKIVIVMVTYTKLF